MLRSFTLTLLFLILTRTAFGTNQLQIRMRGGRVENNSIQTWSETCKEDRKMFEGTMNLCVRSALTLGLEKAFAVIPRPAWIDLGMEEGLGNIFAEGFKDSTYKVVAEEAAEFISDTMDGSSTSPLVAEAEQQKPMEYLKGKGFIMPADFDVIPKISLVLGSSFEIPVNGSNLLAPFKVAFSVINWGNIISTCFFDNAIAFAGMSIACSGGQWSESDEGWWTQGDNTWVASQPNQTYMCPGTKCIRESDGKEGHYELISAGTCMCMANN